MGFDVYIKVQDLENIWWILKEANKVYVYVIKVVGVCGCNPSESLLVHLLQHSRSYSLFNFWTIKVKI